MELASKPEHETGVNEMAKPEKNDAGLNREYASKFLTPAFKSASFNQSSTDSMNELDMDLEVNEPSNAAYRQKYEIEAPEWPHGSSATSSVHSLQADMREDVSTELGSYSWTDDNVSLQTYDLLLQQGQESVPKGASLGSSTAEFSAHDDALQADTAGDLYLELGTQSWAEPQAPSPAPDLMSQQKQEYVLEREPLSERSQTECKTANSLVAIPSQDHCVDEVPATCGKLLLTRGLTLTGCPFCINLIEEHEQLIVDAHELNGQMDTANVEQLTAGVLPPMRGDHHRRYLTQAEMQELTGDTHMTFSELDMSDKVTICEIIVRWLYIMVREDGITRELGLDLPSTVRARRQALATRKVILFNSCATSLSLRMGDTHRVTSGHAARASQAPTGKHPISGPTWRRRQDGMPQILSLYSCQRLLGDLPVDITIFQAGPIPAAVVADSTPLPPLLPILSASSSPLGSAVCSSAASTYPHASNTASVCKSSDLILQTESGAAMPDTVQRGLADASVEQVSAMASILEDDHGPISSTLRESLNLHEEARATLQGTTPPLSNVQQANEASGISSQQPTQLQPLDTASVPVDPLTHYIVRVIDLQSRNMSYLILKPQTYLSFAPVPDKSRPQIVADSLGLITLQGRNQLVLALDQPSAEVTEPPQALLAARLHAKHGLRTSAFDAGNEMVITVESEQEEFRQILSSEYLHSLSDFREHETKQYAELPFRSKQRLAEFVLSSREMDSLLHGNTAPQSIPREVSDYLLMHHPAPLPEADELRRRLILLNRQSAVGGGHAQGMRHFPNQPSFLYSVDSKSRHGRVHAQIRFTEVEGAACMFSLPLTDQDAQAIGFRSLSHALLLDNAGIAGPRFAGCLHLHSLSISDGPAMQFVSNLVAELTQAQQQPELTYLGYFGNHVMGNQTYELGLIIEGLTRLRIRSFNSKTGQEGELLLGKTSLLAWLPEGEACELVDLSERAKQELAERIVQALDITSDGRLQLLCDTDGSGNSSRRYLQGRQSKGSFHSHSSSFGINAGARRSSVFSPDQSGTPMGNKKLEVATSSLRPSGALLLKKRAKNIGAIRSSLSPHRDRLSAPSGIDLSRSSVASHRKQDLSSTQQAGPSSTSIIASAYDDLPQPHLGLHHHGVPSVSEENNSPRQTLELMTGTIGHGSPPALTKARRDDKRRSSAAMDSPNAQLFQTSGRLHQDLNSSTTLSRSRRMSLSMGNPTALAATESGPLPLLQRSLRHTGQLPHLTSTPAEIVGADLTCVNFVRRTSSCPASISKLPDIADRQIYKDEAELEQTWRTRLRRPRCHTNNVDEMSGLGPLELDGIIEQVQKVKKATIEQYQRGILWRNIEDVPYIAFWNRHMEQTLSYFGTPAALHKAIASIQRVHEGLHLNPREALCSLAVTHGAVWPATGELHQPKSLQEVQLAAETLVFERYVGLVENLTELLGQPGI